MRTHEDALIGQVGMDATIFLRFVRMCRNMFLVLALIGVGILVPVNVSSQDIQTGSDSGNWIYRVTPINVRGNVNWAQVAVAYLFDLTIAGFLWWNYRRVLELRRKYFDSEEYQSSLHSRTLMVG